MCGGAYSDPLPLKGWEKVIAFLNRNDADNCVFMELTRGCFIKECSFSCQARLEPYRINITPEKVGVVARVFRHLSHCPIVLFGYGETTRYPYEQIKEWPSKSVVSLVPSKIDYKRLRKLCAGTVIFNIYTDTDAVAANVHYLSLKRPVARAHASHTYSISFPKIFAKIPIVQSIDYFGLAEKVQGPEVLYHAISVGSSKHITKEQFGNEFKRRYGVMPQFKDIPDMSVPAVKPVIEKVSGVEGDAEIVIRRCFKMESQRHTLIAKETYPDYPIISDPVSVEEANCFSKFLGLQPPCSTCEQQTWRASV